MKNKTKILIGLSLSSIIFSTLLIPSRVKEVNAYTVSGLPTTIDLNDSTETEVRSYYNNLTTLIDNERTGENLLKNLKPILQKDQKYYSYDYNNGLSIWQIYEISDRDWSKSPASTTTYGTYNEATNTITNYQYGTNSNPKNNPYIHALYHNRDKDNEAKAFGAHNSNPWGINREHIWPKSRGFNGDDDTKESGGARGDLMHLWAGDGKVNTNVHNNLCYGNVDKSKSYSDYGNTKTDADKEKYDYVKGNLRGTSLTKGSGTVFEPQDSDKGDIARSVFYMVARYNNLSGTASFIDSNEPNLTVLDEVYDESEVRMSTETKAFSMGVLSDLLNWHRMDPVDEYEIHRNNLLFKNYTNNRNPFIDFPEWVEYIWGDKKGTNFVDPTKDALNVGQTQPKVNPTNNDQIIPGVENMYLFIAIGVVVFLAAVVILMISKKKPLPKNVTKSAKKVIKVSKKAVRNGSNSSSNKKSSNKSSSSKKK